MFSKSGNRLDILSTELNNKSKVWIPVGVVKNMYINPIMSCKPKEITNCQIGLYNVISFQNDFILRNNMFVIYNQSTKYIITNKCNPRLNSLEVKAVDEYILKLICEGMPDLILDMQVIQENRVSNSNIVMLRNKFVVKIRCIDCGTKAAEWISSYLGNSDTRLGYNVPQMKSSKPFSYIRERKLLNNMMFYENFPSCQVLSEKSLDYVNANMNHYINMNQHHANIVFEPFLKTRFPEFEWEWISIGNAIIRNVFPDSSYIEPDLPAEVITNLMTLLCEVYISGFVNVGNVVSIHTNKDNAEY